VHCNLLCNLDIISVVVTVKHALLRYDIIVNYCLLCVSHRNTSVFVLRTRLLKLFQQYYGLVIDESLVRIFDLFDLSELVSQLFCNC